LRGDAGVDNPIPGDGMLELDKAVLVRPDVLNLPLAAVRLDVALKVPEEPDHLAFEQGRSAALPCPPDHLARGFPYGEEVGAIDGHTGHAEPGSRIHVGVHRTAVVTRRGFGVAVVLDDEDRRQVPYRREVEALEERPLVRGPIADETDCYLAVPAHLCGQCRPARAGRPRTEDPVGTHHVLREVGDVHQAALTVARTALLAVNLLHHLDDVHALRDAVAMAAVRTGDAVAVVQVHHDAGGRGLLTGVQVHEPGDVTAREVDLQSLLELADGLHRPVGVKQVVPIQGKGCAGHAQSPFRCA
jgi:hypothetical protein